jgi:hypothetical protein
MVRGSHALSKQWRRNFLAKKFAVREGKRPPPNPENCTEWRKSVERTKEIVIKIKIFLDFLKNSKNF